MIFIRSAVFNALFILWTTIVVLTLWIFIPLTPNKFRSIIAIWPKGCFLLLNLVGIEFEIRGESNIPSGPVLFAVKHQSTWETIFFLFQNKDNSYVMKSELARIPFWGWYMQKGGHILVDRNGGVQSMRKMLQEAEDILNDNRSIVIFPEGTRLPPGELGSFYPGVAAIYSQLNLRVVPVAVNSGLFWPRRKFKKNPGRIIIELLPHIKPGLNRKVFMQTLRETIGTATKNLEDEAKKSKVLQQEK